MYLTVSGSTAHNALHLIQLDLLQLHLLLNADISSHLCLISLLLRSCGGQKRHFQSKVHFFYYFASQSSCIFVFQLCPGGGEGHGSLGLPAGDVLHQGVLPYWEGQQDGKTEGESEIEPLQ